MTEQRLPIVNSDDGVWGDIIRQYIMKEHYNDDTDNAANGGHKTITVRAGTATAGSAPVKLTSGTLMSSAEVGALEFNSDFLYFTITTGTNRKKVALYDDSSGATGDIYYRNSSGYFSRIGIGSDGKILKASSSTPTWDYATFATASKTTDYTVTNSDTVIFADSTSGNVTITLPAASGLSGYRFYVKRIDGSANTVSVARTGGDTIDGQTSISMPLQYMSLTLVSNGSNWYII